MPGPLINGTLPHIVEDLLKFRRRECVVVMAGFGFRGNGARIVIIVVAVSLVLFTNECGRLIPIVFNTRNRPRGSGGKIGPQGGPWAPQGP